MGGTENKERIKKKENYKIDHQVEMKSRIFMKAQSVMCSQWQRLNSWLDRGHLLLRGHESLLLTLLCLAHTLLCVIVTDGNLRLEGRVRGIQGEIQGLQEVSNARAKLVLGKLKGPS